MSKRIVANTMITCYAEIQGSLRKAKSRQSGNWMILATSLTTLSCTLDGSNDVSTLTKSLKLEVVHSVSG